MVLKIVIFLCVVALTYASTPVCPNPVPSSPAVACVFVPDCQFPENGSLTVLARQCANDLPDSDCEQLFPCDSTATPPCNPDGAVPGADADSYPFVRAPACTNPSLHDVAMKCASTCALCCQAPEFNCDDDVKSPLDCELNEQKCKDANWTNIMAQYCPKTCGLCDAGGCRDLNTGCNTVVSLCKHVDFIDYMRKNCARTCDFCPGSSSSTCRDIAANCAQNSNLCTNSIYRDLMQQQCCATCGGGYGSTLSPSGTCSDTNSNCANWVRNGFCNSSFYTPDQKRQYCGRSCNLC